MTNAFGIYIHLPFCTHRCSYCDFFSLTDFDDSRMELVASAICSELEWNVRHLSEEGLLPGRVGSLFLGGGTPSLFATKQIQRILETAARCFGLTETAEITMEINPETVTVEKAHAWKNETIINRVSLGVQSTDERFLKILERLASPRSVVDAVHRLQDAGFFNLNLDLIFGIPGQEERDIERDIEKVSGLGPSHLSYYQLTLKPGHKLYEALPGEEAQIAFYEMGRKLLEEKGYSQYEVSNFSKPDSTCFHNLLYWNGGDFLGIGPSASSRFFVNDSFRHFKQVSDLAGYLKQDFSIPRRYDLSTRKQSALEGIFLEIRKNDGINTQAFNARYGVDLTRSKNFPRYLEAGWISWQEASLRLTDKGRLLADQISSDLLD